MKNNDLKIALCAIGKFEEKYLVEWIEYYKNLSFDNIIFGDNNPMDDYEQYNILKPYINEGFVIYKNLKGEEGRHTQKKFYKKMIMQYKDVYDYICFFDVDEFLTFDKKEGIQTFLKSKKFFNDYDFITIPLVNVGDNNLIHYEEKLLVERFKFYKLIGQNVKSILNMKRIREKKEEIQIKSVHRMIDGKKYRVSVSNGVYLKHFKFKTIEEFIKKIERGDVNYRYGFELKKEIEKRLMFFIKEFFEFNEITDEKVELVLKKYPSFNKKITELLTQLQTPDNKK